MGHRRKGREGKRTRRIKKGKERRRLETNRKGKKRGRRRFRYRIHGERERLIKVCVIVGNREKARA